MHVLEMVQSCLKALFVLLCTVAQIFEASSDNLACTVTQELVKVHEVKKNKSTAVLASHKI